MSKKVRVGDVFVIPIDAGRYGIGQVAGNWKGELYIVIYDAVYPTQDVDPKSVLNIKILFAALSLDAKLYHGDWVIIGNVPESLSIIPQPVYKVNQGGGIFLESRDRSLSRPASSSEAAVLRLRTVVAPVGLEKALQAHYGVGSWNTAYDALFADYAVKSSQLVAT